MTMEFVPFTATVHWLPIEDMGLDGVIMLIKDNPSGSFEHYDALEIPVQF
jgi:hypothetical protein